MNDFYMDFMLRERRKNESREYERRRFLNAVRTPPRGDLRNCGRCCKEICIDFKNFFRVAGLGLIKEGKNMNIVNYLILPVRSFNHTKKGYSR